MENFTARRPFQMEYRARRADGQFRWILDQGVPRFDEDGVFLGYIGGCIDITERKMAEAALQHRNEELEQTQAHLQTSEAAAAKARLEAARFNSFGRILERSDNEIYIFDASSLHFVHVNQGARANLGYTMEELRTMTPLDLKPEYTAAAFEATIAPLRSHAIGRIAFTTVHHRKDGSRYPVEVHLELSDFDNRPAFVALILDATKRQQMEDELRQSREIAIAADRAKSEFLANMSHEIRTPMTAILGYADLLYQEGDITRAPAGRINAIRTVQRNGEHLLAIINDILDLSKIEAGKLSIESMSCSPDEIVQDVFSLMKVRAHAKGINLCVEYATPVPESILSDPTRIRQILVNLVGNAIKFTEVGQVRIIARLVPGDTPKIEFDVVDTGIGMTSEQNRLFSFRRPTSMAATGTGWASISNAHLGDSRRRFGHD
jgi:PAS domain S-box-containing protein